MSEIPGTTPEGPNTPANPVNPTDPAGSTGSDPTVDIQDENVPLVGGIGATGSDQVPQTGDTVAVIIWAGLSVASLLGMAVFFVHSKKKSA